MDPVTRQFGRMARKYDVRWAGYVGASVRETLCRIGPKVDGRVLDVGCGTGTLLVQVRLACPAAELWGLDVSQEMLRVTRGKLDHRVHLVVGRAESLPFTDEYFDTVVSTSAFHYVREPVRALGEFTRVLKRHGRVVITDWCDDFLTCKICDRILRVFDRAHHRIYTQQECRRLVEDARFDSVQVEKYRINWLWGMMTASGVKPAVEKAAGADGL